MRRAAEIPPHVARDGVLRNPQVSADVLAAGPWDGRTGSYIPAPTLDVDPSLELHTLADIELDPITYQVLRGRIWHKNLEQCDVIQRVSGSVPVVYSRDFATAILTEDGEVVTISPTVCFFSTMADLIVKWTLEHRSRAPGIADGDVFLQNDPFIGAAQQSDTSFYAPVFWEGKLFCWVFNTLHVGDIGGVDPGGWAIHARDIFDESVTVPPMKIVERGTTRWDLVDAYVRQRREPDGVLLNVKSALAGVAATRAQMREMLESFGAAQVKGAMRRMIADCSKVVAQRLSQIPDGTWSERMYVTGLIGERQTHQEVLTLSKHGDRVVCTNAGTSPQGGPGNSTYGFLRSSVVGALATALAWDQMGCVAGVANHVSFEPVAGTRSVARWPAAVSGHLSTFITLNVASLVTSKMVLSGPPEVRSHAYALGGLALPLGDVAFGLNEDGTLVVGTPNSAGGAAMGGCIGAFPFRDGIDSGGSWWLVGSSAGNVEENEETGVPVILYRSENPDSGGPGTWRGGNSLTVGWVPGKAHIAASQMTWADPGTNPAAGLAGGYYGLGGNFLRLGSSQLAQLMGEGRLPASRAEIEELAGPLTRLGPTELVLPLPPGDCIVVEFNGSGGYGDPLGRDPSLVAADVRDGAVTIGARPGATTASSSAPPARSIPQRRSPSARRSEPGGWRARRPSTEPRCGGDRRLGPPCCWPGRRGAWTSPSRTASRCGPARHAPSCSARWARTSSSPRGTATTGRLTSTSGCTPTRPSSAMARWSCATTTAPAAPPCSRRRCAAPATSRGTTSGSSARA
jgi:N-methylhydantoinase B